MDLEALLSGLLQVWADLPRRAGSSWPAVFAMIEQLVEEMRSGRAGALGVVSRPDVDWSILEACLDSETEGTKYWDLPEKSRYSILARDLEDYRGDTLELRRPPKPEPVPARREEVEHRGLKPDPLTRLLGHVEAVRRRCVNVCITEGEAHSVVSDEMQLGTDRDYDLRIDIGPFSSDSVVINAEENPFPEHVLPRSETGHWLEVIAVGDEFVITPEPHNLFLPTTGRSWVCTCVPGSDHSCHETERRDHLFIPMKAPKEAGTRRVRIGVYFAKNLIQSQLLTAEVSDEPRVGAGYGSSIDYSLTASLKDVGFLPARTVHILTNPDSASAHQLVINTGLNKVFVFNLAEDKIKTALETVRKALRDIHFKEYGGQLRASVQRDNLYDENNAKSKEKFIGDLRKMALLGHRLYTALLWYKPQRDELETFLKQGEAKIQVSRPSGSTVTFPWALMYDIPLVSNQRKWKHCRILEEWNGGAFSSGGHLCPYEAEHTLNTICPFGFWGFRYLIEQPPSLPLGHNLPYRIKTGSQRMEIVVARSITMDSTLSTAHLKAIQEKLPNFSWTDCQTSDDCCSGLGHPDLQLVYFYCHGKRDQEEGSSVPLPYLEIGEDDRIYPSDITDWDRTWPKDHWKEISPLVFINGCHTAELTPELLVNFVDSFVGNLAAGVIGTETTLHQRVAGEAAEVFFSRFSHNASVGEAIRSMRLHLLRKGNLMGLSYTPYCSGDLGLSP